MAKKPRTAASGARTEVAEVGSDRRGGWRVERRTVRRTVEQLVEGTEAECMAEFDATRGALEPDQDLVVRAPDGIVARHHHAPDPEPPALRRRRRRAADVKVPPTMPATPAQWRAVQVSLARALGEQTVTVLVEEENLSPDDMFFSAHNINLADGEAVGTGAQVNVLFAFADQLPRDRGASWAHAIVRAGLDAARRTAAAVAAKDSFEDLASNNTLSFIGNTLSHAVRQELLRNELVASEWNLTRCAKRLRMTGTGNVLRAIKDLGLTAELEAARREGLVTRAWNKPKPGR